MNFEEWDWDKEGRDVNEYLRSKESDEWLSEFFRTTTPEDLDSIVKRINGSKGSLPNPRPKKKRKKRQETNRITDLMDKYDLSCEYVIEEFIVDDDIIDPEDN